MGGNPKINVLTRPLNNLHERQNKTDRIGIDMADILFILLFHNGPKCLSNSEFYFTFHSAPRYNTEFNLHLISIVKNCRYLKLFLVKSAS